MPPKFKSYLPVCLFFAALPAGAQLFSVGVRGGVPLNDAYTAVSNPTVALSTDRFVIGPTVELHLPFGFGAQVDALYRSYTVGGTVTQWEFPILATYHFHKVGPLLRPFVDGGPTFNHIGIPSSANFTARSAAGVALGAGVEAKFLLLRVEPEIRWTHWGRTNFTYSTANSVFSSNQNEVEFLVGVTF